MLPPSFIESLEERQFFAAAPLSVDAMAAPRPLPVVAARATAGASPSVAGTYEGRVNYVRGDADNLGAHAVVLKLAKGGDGKRLAGTLTVPGVGKFKVLGTVKKDGTFDFGFAKNRGFFRGEFTDGGRVVAGMCVFINGVEHAGEVRLGPTQAPAPNPGGGGGTLCPPGSFTL